MRGISLISKPLSWLYGLILWVRHQAYDRGFFHSKSFHQPIVKIGNLSFGGTGKTPMTIFLAEYLVQRSNVFVLSRGYSRFSKGFIQVLENSDVLNVADEPLLIKTRVPKSNMYVCENRIEGVCRINKIQPLRKVIILDDALQHRSLQGGFSILMTDYNLPFYKDYLAPLGKLRDLKMRAAYVDLIVVSKCPYNLIEKEKQAIKSEINRYADKPVLFSRIEYLSPKNLFSKKEVYFSSVIAIATSIADPRLFIEYLQTVSCIAKHFIFSDHHIYTKGDVNKMLSYLKANCPEVSQLVVTEKDAVKLMAYQVEFKVCNIELIAVPIKVFFEEDDLKQLHGILDNYIENE